ncbi:MAG: cellulase family glycosylhydrolase [Bacteroidales bacterium]
MYKIALVLIFSTFNATFFFPQEYSLKLTVDASLVVSQMKGGIGASWHAMVNEIPLENEKYDYPVRIINPRGSGYGANPPLTDTLAWKQLYNHASWLGLDFLRVELSQRMYEPQREVFDWDNEEMKVLYKILDWCQANDADVFLQQMWGHVEWNAFPGVHPLLSAPKSLDDFANGIATLLEYLTKTKKYTCIKYFCITNEPPGGTWGYWWSYGSGSGAVTPAWKKVRETLDSRGINIPLSGPDWTSLPPFDASKIDFDDFIGAYDIHSYGGIGNKDEMIMYDWVRWAHKHKKPFFISEFGNMNLGWGGTNEGPKTFAASLSNAMDVVKGMNSGVDGFNRWSFVNRGDLDGQWQLVKTFDIDKKVHLSEITPEKTAYYGFAMLSRFQSKYASMLQWHTDYCIDGIKPTAFKNSDGSIVILIVNQNLEESPVNLGITGIDPKTVFYLYQLTEDAVSLSSFKLEPIQKLTSWKKEKQLKLPGASITLLTTRLLKNDEDGLIK